ncbi:MAG TPA: hypothetical protein VI911_11135 [Patescibacteria group bacterium]|nr:hypothetical protein [Patescibacteria group bacterium]
MSLFSGLSDIATSSDGDMLVEGSDLKKVNGIDWFIQEVNKILRSANDWFFAPNAGAALDRFYGSNNTREIATEIQDIIKSKIERQGISFPATLNVRVVPLSRDEIKVYINLNFNNENINISKLIFDLQKGSIKETEEIEKQQSTKTPNKHPYAGKFL